MDYGEGQAYQNSACIFCDSDYGGILLSTLCMDWNESRCRDLLSCILVNSDRDFGLL